MAASLSKDSKTLALEKDGSASKTKAAPPETCGQAIEVPLKVAVAVSDRWPADLTSLPGAQMFVHVP